MKTLQVVSYAQNSRNTLITTLGDHGLEGLVEVHIDGYWGNIGVGVALGSWIILKGEHCPGGLIDAREIDLLPERG